MFVTIIYFLLPLIIGTSCESNTAVIFTDSDFKGQSIKINATTCVSPLPDGFDNSISSINGEGHCFNLYKDENCEGEYIIIKPGTPVHSNLGFWEGFNDQVSSIGPCYPDCDIRNIETRPENVSTFVTVYDHSDFKGYHTTIDVKGCVDIPRKLKKRVSSIKSDDTSAFVCLEFHEHWNCTGKAIQLRKGSPFHSNLGHWALNDNAGAISLCGYNCIRQPNDSKRNFTTPGPDMVTLYDEPDFNGNFKHYSINKGCLDISDEFEGESYSIQTYSQCTIIYERSGCSRVGKSLQLDNSNKKAQRNLKSVEFERVIRSIESCSSNRITKASEMGNSPYDDKSGNTFQIVLFTLLGFFVMGLGVAGVIIIRMRRSHKRVIEILTEKEIEEFLRGCENPVFESSDTTDLIVHSQPYDQNYEIPKEFLDIDMKSTLGAGEYAIVYKGVVRRPNCIEEREVAVKTVKPYSGVEYVRALLKEVKTMIYVGQHPRIVELVGCYTQNLQNAELFVMTELCENGCMEKFLRNNRESFVNLVEKGQIDLDKLLNNPQGNYANINKASSSHFNTIHLFQWSMQIAEGMEYLASKKTIHGDLASRNVLLDCNFSAKISDFGLSRQLYEYTQYVKKHQAPLPWRSLAIESLKSLRFSTESDVWAFGVLIWEIFTLGDTPYPGLVWGDNFLTSLTDGLRLSKPNYATSDCYNLMVSCWRERPIDRITFPDLRLKFQEILNQYSSLIQNTCHNKEYVDLLG